MQHPCVAATARAGGADLGEAVEERPQAHLAFGPRQMPKQIGYICFLKDPDGNTIEFSFDQGVYEKAREVWGRATAST